MISTQCVMMQGGYIEHCALPCHGARERITMVTSFRPKGKIVSDISNLKTIRSCSNSYEMYDQVRWRSWSRLNPAYLC
jgi:hypothetical protein